MEESYERTRDGIKLVVCEFFRREATRNAEFRQAELQPLFTCAFSRDSHDILGGSWIAFNHGNSVVSNRARQPDSSRRQLLHAWQQTWVHVDAPPFEDSLADP